jgi:hypothetical protein
MFLEKFLTVLQMSGHVGNLIAHFSRSLMLLALAYLALQTGLLFSKANKIASLLVGVSNQTTSANAINTNDDTTNE